jgi:hypothetical protein
MLFASEMISLAIDLCKTLLWLFVWFQVFGGE